jgi:CubicO group peptidase (beta-lactamase class C family)
MFKHRHLLPLFLACASSLFAEKPVGVSGSLLPFIQSKTISGGVALVVSPDKVLALESQGFSDLEKQQPMQTDAMFWIASMTKPMTAMAVMMLVEEGKINIADPVAKYLPEFKDQMLAVEKTPERVVLQKPARRITVKDLLTHTSGLVSVSPLDKAALDTLTLREAVITYALSPLQFEPGSKWSYCNPGINTLGRIVEVVSGKPYAEFMQERLFTPLGMKDTTFWPTDEQVKRVAKSYKQNAAKKGLEETTVSFLTVPITNRERMALPAGGLFSCAEDLAKLYQMLLNRGEWNGRRYLQEATLQVMTTNQLGDMPKVSFVEGMHMGLGFHIVHQPMGVSEVLSQGSFGHGGAYGTQAWIDPVKKLAIVLLIQRQGLPNSDGSELRAALQKAAMEKFGK